MKKEIRRKPKLVEVTIEDDVEIFTAEDGTEFDREYECRLYEAAYLNVPVEINFKHETIRDTTHFKCETEEEFKNALIFFAKSKALSRSFLYIFWNQFNRTNGDWFYFDVDETGDNVYYSIEKSITRLGDLKEFVQEYSDLQRLFLEGM